jgi:hypothetical protein
MLFFSVFSQNSVTTFTGSPASSMSYPVVFSNCSDSDGNNYPVVIIGDQTWMAKNLSWLPQVGSASDGSRSDKKYYVYNYSGTQVSLAN